MNTFGARSVFRFLITCIYVARDAEAGIVCQYAVQTLRSIVSTIRHRNLARM